MKRLEITLISSKIFPLHSDGGTAFTTYEQASALAKEMDVDVSVLLFSGEDRQESISKVIKKFDLRWVSNFNFLSELKNEISRSDVLWIHSAFKWQEFFFLIFLVRKPRVVWWSAHGSLDKLLINSSIRKWLYTHFFIRFLARFITHYICNSSGERSKLPFFLRHKARVVTNLAPKHTLALEGSMAPLERECCVVPQSRYFLFLGRLTSKKRVIDTVAWFEREYLESDRSLVIVGPPESDKYAAEVSRAIECSPCKQRILFHPRSVKGETKIRLIEGADAIVLFSESEGLPVAILEALQLGTKAICSPQCNVPGSDYVFVSSIQAYSALVVESFLSKDVSEVPVPDIGRVQLNNLIADLNGWVVNENT